MLPSTARTPSQPGANGGECSVPSDRPPPSPQERGRKQLQWAPCPRPNTLNPDLWDWNSGTVLEQVVGLSPDPSPPHPQRLLPREKGTGRICSVLNSYLKHQIYFCIVSYVVKQYSESRVNNHKIGGYGGEKWDQRRSQRWFKSIGKFYFLL